MLSYSFGNWFSGSNYVVMSTMVMFDLSKCSGMVKKYNLDTVPKLL